MVWGYVCLPVIIIGVKINTLFDNAQHTKVLCSFHSSLVLQTSECVSEQVIQYYDIPLSFSVETEYILSVYDSIFTDFFLHSNCISFHKIHDILHK